MPVVEGLDAGSPPARREPRPRAAPRGVRSVARVYPPIEREEEFHEYVQRRKARRSALAQQITPEVAARASGITRAYPWMRPGVVSSLTAAGLDADHPAVGRAAAVSARLAVDEGDFRMPGSPNRTRRPRPFGWLADIAERVEGTAQRFEDNVGEAVEDVAEAGGRAVGGARRLAGRAAGGVADAVSAGVQRAEASDNEVVLAGVGVSATDFRALTRGAVTLLNAPIQEASREVVEAATTPFGRDPLTGQVGAPSDLRLAYRAQQAGQPVDLGSGYLPGGAIRQQALDLRSTAQLPGLTPGQTEALNALPGDNAGTWASPGRLLARLVFEPGSAPFNVASGVGDAAFSLATDPTSFLTPGRGAVSVLQRGQRVGRTMVDEVPGSAGRMGRLFGAVADTAPTTLNDEIDGALSSGPGRLTVEHFAASDSFTDIWQRTNGKLGHRLTEELTRTHDQGRVRELLSERMRTGVDRNYPFISPSRTADLVRPRTDRLRFMQTVPGKTVDATDLDGAVTELIRSGRNALLDPADIERTIRGAASLDDGDYTGLLNVVKDHFADVSRQLLDKGATPEEARRLAGKVFEGTGDEYRAYSIDEIGGHADFPGARTATIGGQTITRPSPHIESELLNRAVPLPDYREVRRATAGLRGVLRQRKALPNWLVRGAIDATGVVMSQVVQPAWLLKGSWVTKVTMDLQQRMAMMGVDSLASHPAAFLTWAVSGDKNALGRWVADNIGETGISRTVRGGLAERGMIGRGQMAPDDAKVLRGLDDMRAQAAQQRDWYTGRGRAHPADHDIERYAYSDDPARAVSDWADEILTYAKDPLMRTSARMPRNVMQDWYAGAGGAQYRTNLARSKVGQELTPEEVARYGTATFDEAITTSREFMNDYAESYWRRLSARTNDHGEVLEAIARGKIPNRAGDDVIDITEIDDLTTPQGREFRRWVEERISDGPDWHRGARFTDGAGTATKIGEQADQLMNVAFEWLFTRGDQAMSRSPATLQFFWSRAREMVPFMDEPTRRAFVASAKTNKLGKAYVADFQRLADNVPLDPEAAITDVETASNIARKYALDSTNELLYDATKRHQYSDIVRILSPFAEPMIEALTVWPRRALRNPRRVRRIQQTVSGAKGAGIFYEDPVSEELTFAYPIAGLARALGMPEGITANFTGKAGNLQTMFPGIGGDRGLVGGVLPGIGPVVQIPAARWLPEMPQTQYIEELLFPFGRPDPEAGLGEQITDVASPAWARSLDQLWMREGEGERVWDNTVMEIMQALVSSGDYTNAETGAVDVDRLEADSLRRAPAMFGIKAVAQFFLPAGATPAFGTEVEGDGRHHLVRALGAELQRLHDDMGYNEGNEYFIEHFGDAAYAAAQSKSRSTEVAALSEEGASWELANRELVEAYPHSRSYFAPGDRGELDIDALMAQYGTDVRDTKTPEQYARLTNRNLGNIAYDAARQSLIDSGRDPQGEQGQAWLSEVSRRLEEEYPGFGHDIEIPGLPVTASLKQQLAELETASADPRMVNHSDAQTARNAVSIAQWFEARDMVNARAVELYGDEGSVERAGVTGAMRSKKTMDLRDWLRQVGAALIEDNPSFEGVYERVLSRELAEDDYRPGMDEEG